MIRNVLGAVLVLALVPLALHAQPPQDRIDAAVAKVVDRGIPQSVLENQIAKGRAKGVPAARIAEAAERRADALVRTQEAFERAAVQPREADYVAGADAIGRGVSEAALAAVADGPPESRAVAIAVLGELVAQGMPVADALARVENAVAGGPGALANLPAQAAEAVGRRGPPAAAGQGHAGAPANAGPPSGVSASAGGADARRGPPANRGGPPNR